MMSEAISASLDYYRAMRDATSEAMFFQTYGSVFSLYLADKGGAEGAMLPVADARELPFVQSALAAIGEGGYPEALARVAVLLARKGEPLLLSRLELKSELMKDYRDLLPDLPLDQWRRIRGEQEIVVRYEPERALETLPKLLAKREDRERLVKLVRALLADERLRRAKPTAEQVAMIEDIGASLDVVPARSKAVRATSSHKPRKRAAKRTAGRKTASRAQRGRP
jgi:hypothetical protein